MLRFEYMHHIVEIFPQVRIWIKCSILEKRTFRACLIFLCELTLNFTSAKGACPLPASLLAVGIVVADAIVLVAFHKLITFFQVVVFKPDAEVLLDGNLLYQCGYFVKSFLQVHPALYKFIFSFLAVCYVMESDN